MKTRTNKKGQKILFPRKVVNKFKRIESRIRKHITAQGLHVVGIAGEGKSLHSGRLPKLRPMTGTRFVQGKQI